MYGFTSARRSCHRGLARGGRGALILELETVQDSHCNTKLPPTDEKETPATLSDREAAVWARGANPPNS